MTDDPGYDEWIAKRRAYQPSNALPDQVMAAVERQQMQQKVQLRLPEQIAHSLLARCAACLSAFVVGSLPFLLVAYVAKLIVI